MKEVQQITLANIININQAKVISVASAVRKDIRRRTVSHCVS